MQLWYKVGVFYCQQSFLHGNFYIQWASIISFFTVFPIFFVTDQDLIIKKNHKIIKTN